jgi:hypothetical protein
MSNVSQHMRLGPLVRASLTFGGLAIVLTAICFAVIGLLVAIVGVLPKAAGSFALPAWISGPLLLFAPVALFVAAAIFALPSGVIAALIFFLASWGVVALKLSRLFAIPVGTISGLAGAVVVFQSATSCALGSTSGLVASLLLLFLPRFASISAPLSSGQAGAHDRNG